MKTKITLAVLAAASVLTLSATAASAAPRDRYDGRTATQTRWTSINERQSELDRRIDMGARHGDLTRQEARRLRMQFNQIAQLESRYRANGLSAWERADLDRRFDRLSMQIRGERRDSQYGYGYGAGGSRR
jgi:Ni/Co efflux regulator RcnB